MKKSSRRGGNLLILGTTYYKTPIFSHLHILVGRVQLLHTSEMWSCIFFRFASVFLAKDNLYINKRYELLLLSIAF